MDEHATGSLTGIVNSSGINTDWLFPIACAIAAAMFVTILTNGKKFGGLISVIVGVIIGCSMLYILPHFTTWTGSL